MKTAEEGNTNIKLGKADEFFLLLLKNRKQKKKMREKKGKYTKKNF